MGDRFASGPATDTMYPMAPPCTSSAPTDTKPYPAGSRVGVLLPLPLEGAYDYRVPDNIALGPGDFVVVPLGGRESIGVIWGKGEGAVDEGRLRLVSKRLDAPPMGGDMRRFIAWVAKYTLYPIGAVLRMAMSVPDALHPPRPEVTFAIAVNAPTIRMTPAREKVLAALRGGPPRSASALARTAGVTPGVILGLAKVGMLECRMLTRNLPVDLPDWRLPGPSLSPEQTIAAADFSDMVGKGFSVSLLDGVPGSGKTEVYYQAVAEALKQGQQVLVLLPEIALSTQWLDRFRQRFGSPPALWHSEVTGAQRRATWRAVAEGRATVVVGARSALFLPFPDLGLIVVDEEHDAAYKQEEGVIYNGRDMAVVRANLSGFPIILCSATPSLETVANVTAGRYTSRHLPDRHGAAATPKVELIDMRTTPAPPGAWLSPPVRQALTETLGRSEQAMLFLNRRGYAPLTLCRTCGHRMQCPRCTAWLVEHRQISRLQCHHCGHALPLPTACPACEAEGGLVALGPGIERLAEEVDSLFPDIRRVVVASDTLRGPAAAAEIVSAMEERRIDLVIGTQVLAKGHHFPHLTLVSVIDADLGLSGGDLRGAERTFQLLYQVAGRAGRAERQGRVLMQTYMPEHPVMAALAGGDRDRFIAAESAARQLDGMPPYGRLVALVLSAPSESAVASAARALARKAPHGAGINVLGPAPAPLSLLRGRYRWRFLVKVSREIPVQPLIRQWLASALPPSQVRIQVDVDPYSFL